LAEVDGEDLCEGRVVAEGFEVDEFDEDVRVLLGVAVVEQLFFDVVDFA